MDDENTVDSLGIEMHHNSNGGSRSSGGGGGGYDHHNRTNSGGDHHNGTGDRMATIGTNSSGYRSSNATITVVPHSFRRNPMYLPSPANSNCNTATLTNAIGTSGQSTTASSNTSVLNSNMIKSGLYPVSGEAQDKLTDQTKFNSLTKLN